MVDAKGSLYRASESRSHLPSNTSRTILSASGKSKYYKYRDRGILKPTTTNKGIINKLSNFFNRYSLSGYENNTNTDELQRSIPLEGYNYENHPVINKAKKLRYDDGKYVLGELPDLNQQTRKHKQVEVQQSTVSDGYSVKSLSNDLERKKYEVNRLVRDLDDKVYELKRAKRELHDMKKENEYLRSGDTSLRRQVAKYSAQYSEAQALSDEVNAENVELNRQLTALRSHTFLLQLKIDQLLRDRMEDRDLALFLKLQVNTKEYENQLLYLNNEYEKFKMVDNPKIKFKFYDQISDKLLEFEEFLASYQSIDDVHRFDYKNMVDLKSIIYKLYEDLTQKFTRNSHKHMTMKVVHFLSLNYQLRVKCLNLLHVLDEILIYMEHQNA